MKIIRKLVILFIKLALVFIILILPLFSGIFTGFIFLKTYNVSFDILKKDYVYGKEDKEVKELSLSSRASNIITQTTDYIKKEPPKFKWGTEERVNILLLGKASEDYPGSNLTDTIILASYNPKTGDAAMLSIPRDLYVQIPDTNRYTKLNYIYHYGTQKDGNRGGIRYMSRVIKEITNQQVNYFILIDFKGFVKLVDEVEGVSVDVKKEIHDTRYPGPNYSYQTFHIDPGVQTLDGETALKYVRTRHDQDGDFGRAFRQQQVLMAMKNKFFNNSSLSLITKLNSILNIISENVETDIEFSEYGAFLNATRDLTPSKITNKVIDNRGQYPILMSVSQRTRGGYVYYLKPVTGDYSQIHELSQNIFNLEKIQKLSQKKEEENPKILLINKSGNRSNLNKTYDYLKQAGYTQIEIQNRTSDYNNSTTYDIIEKTIIHDNTQGIKVYTLDDLIKILKAEPPTETYLEEYSQYDFIIELGNNLPDFSQQKEITLPPEAWVESEY
jgi:LCP family protein required for cell wall assembly